MSHCCAAVGCSTVISDEKLMCLHHWQLVPSRLQAQINSTWRAIRARRTAQERLRAIHEYRTAKDQAIEAVRKAGPLA